MMTINNMVKEIVAGAATGFIAGNIIKAYKKSNKYFSGDLPRIKYEALAILREGGISIDSCNRGECRDLDLEEAKALATVLFIEKYFRNDPHKIISRDGRVIIRANLNKRFDELLGETAQHYRVMVGETEAMNRWLLLSNIANYDNLTRVQSLKSAFEKVFWSRIKNNINLPYDILDTKIYNIGEECSWVVIHSIVEMERETKKIRPIYNVGDVVA